MNSIPTSVTIAPASGTRIKLHVYTSSSPILLLRVVRFLAQRAVAVEIGNNFVNHRSRTNQLNFSKFFVAQNFIERLFIR